MRKVLCLLMCVLLSTIPMVGLVAGSEPPVSMLMELRDKYADLSIQAGVILKEPLSQPEPPSATIVCSDEEAAKEDGQNLDTFLKAFSAPEGPLCDELLSTQKQMQLLGEYPGYEREAALTDRLGRKVQLLIRQYGKDLTTLPAVTAAGLQTVKAIQLLGFDATGRADTLMASLSDMHAAAVEEMFRLLTEEHDYTYVQPLLDAARNSQLLGGTSGINTDKFLARLQNALHFELEIVYRIDLPFEHWEEKVTLQMVPASLDNLMHLRGSGTGAMTVYSNDDVPEAYYEAPDFQVEAELTDFLPCKGTVMLTLSPFYPPKATLVLPDEDEEFTIKAEMPLMQTGWELAQESRLQEGKYVFPLTLNNLAACAIDETIQASPTGTLATVLDITLTHMPAQ